MFEATKVFARKGMFKETVLASSITSREDARKQWPLVVSDTNRRLVTWVRSSWDETTMPARKTKREHFRCMPPSVRITDGIVERAAAETLTPQQLRVHERAKKLLVGEIQRRIDVREPLNWGFKDKERPLFPCCGNLLQGATNVHEEYGVSTPFEKNYIIDIAITSEIAGRQEVVGGVEIEHSHEFTGLRAMLLRCLGFPLISVDVSRVDSPQVDEAWAADILSRTTLDHPLGRRDTYIYVPDLLLPVYTNVPIEIDKERKQQYLVFASDDELDRIHESAIKVASDVGYDMKCEFSSAKITDKSTQSAAQLHKAGLVVGQEWKQINRHQCRRITLPRVDDDVRGQCFMRRMAKVLLCECNALVGYQYVNGVEVDDPLDDVWMHEMAGFLQTTKIGVLPKWVAYPVRTIMSVLDDIEMHQ